MPPSRNRSPTTAYGPMSPSASLVTGNVDPKHSAASTTARCPRRRSARRRHRSCGTWGRSVAFMWRSWPPEVPPERGVGGGGASAAVAVGDRHAPVAAEGLRGDPDTDRRLAPLPLGDVDHASDAL